MKKSIYRFALILLALVFVAPSVLNVVSFAADTSKEEDDWLTVLDPAYTASMFDTVESRIAGDTTIDPMNEMACANGYALYNDPKTGEVICLKLAEPDENGEYIKDEKGVYKYVGYYCTNPYNLGMSKAVGSTADTTASVKKTLLSQLLVKYSENTTETTLESYTSSAMFDQINVRKIRGGLRVEYTIGREETTYLVPRQIRFDKWMNLLIQIAENSTTAKDKRTFFSYYLVKATGTEQFTTWKEEYLASNPEITTATRDYLFMTRKEYNDKIKSGEINEKTDVSWGIRAGVVEKFIVDMGTKSDKTIEENIKSYPCIKNFAIMVIDGTVKAAEIRRIEQYVKLYTDYTKEQMEEDHNETDYVAQDKIPALFKMAIEYTIDEQGLYIRLNAGKIRFDSSNYTLQSITFLPYAGACDTHNEGYIFSPDGSGTLFNLKQIAGSQFTTTSQIYGQDFAYHSVTGANKEVIRYPVYGAVESIITSEEYTELVTKIDENGEEYTEEKISTKDTATNYGYLAVITSGDSLAKLTVSNGGSLHMYASAYTTFNPRPSDTYSLTGGISAGTDAMWTVESKRRYTGDYGIRVFLLSGKDASYTGMANTYRNYLENNGTLKKLENTSEDIPLYLETLGAIDATKTVLGIPVRKSVPLTSFSKTIEVLKTLKNDAKINNIKILMQGWCNEGMLPLVPSGVEVCEALGGEEAFKELIAFAANRENGNISLYPNFDFMLACKDKMFDGFSVDDLSRTIDDQSAMHQYYDAIYQGFGYSGLGIISPNRIEYFYNETFKEYQNFNVGGIAVTTTGEFLSSDFNEDDPLNREDSKKIVSRLLKTVNEQNKSVMVAGGNAYTWQYATDIVSIPLDDSRYKYTEAAVPFMGMVLHGYVEFTGTAINLAGDYQYQLLKTIENGANPLFVIAVDNTAELKNWTGSWLLDDYYSIMYAIWLGDINSTYKTLNAALKDVQNSLIVGHEYIDNANRVVKVTYDNGTVFFINYAMTDYEVTYGNEIITVKGCSFVKTTVEKGEVTNG